MTLIDTPFLSFLIVTLLGFGFISYLSGKALAYNWKSLLLVCIYAPLIAAGDRFLMYALFSGDIINLTIFISRIMLFGIIIALSYRLSHIQIMKQQYPWIFDKKSVIKLSRKKYCKKI